LTPDEKKRQMGMIAARRTVRFLLMKQPIVFDGARRLRGSPELKARLSELRESVRARHAAQMAKAGLFHRLILHWRMATEFRRERRKSVPSDHALYCSRIAAPRSDSV
jgi:hypothetical protein